uniref:ZP domain-containing protein n=1 Tax=Globodera pallida TaxID=36090 RepID=A0A183C5I2_GLOPA
MAPPFSETLHCELMLLDVTESDPPPADFPLFLPSQSSLPFTRIEILVKVTTLCYHPKCCRRGEYSKEFLVETTADRTIGEVTTSLLGQLEFSEEKAKQHGLSIMENSKKFASCHLSIKNSRLVRDGRTYVVTVPDEAFC